MARFLSEYDRTVEVEKRLFKASWVNRYHKGDADAAAIALAKAHGFQGRIGYMRDLCGFLRENPGRKEFQQAVRDYHQLGLRLLSEKLEDCEITDDPKLQRREDPLSDLVGDCYRLAYYFVLDNAPDDSFLIHGHIGRDRDSDQHIGHAWVELPGDIVYDGVLLRFYHKDGYYKKRNARRTLAFPKNEVLMTFFNFHHFGPWCD